MYNCNVYMCVENVLVYFFPVVCISTDQIIFISILSLKTSIVVYYLLVKLLVFFNSIIKHIINKNIYLYETKASSII